MPDIVRLAPSPVALVRPARPAADPMSAKRANLGFDATLAFVEQAAEHIRVLQRDNEAAARQLADLREQLRREQLSRQEDADKLEQIVGHWHRRITTSETELSEAKALAIAAIKRCEDLSAQEAQALQRANLAEARAAEVEDCLTGLQNAIEFEFSSVLPRHD